MQLAATPCRFEFVHFGVMERGVLITRGIEHLLFF
jgi:hypothetical protein